MNKKSYSTPEIKYIDTSSDLMKTFSGGGTDNGDPMIDPERDTSDDDNRSRRTNFDVWEE